MWCTQGGYGWPENLTKERVEYSNTLLKVLLVQKYLVVNDMLLCKLINHLNGKLIGAINTMNDSQMFVLIGMVDPSVINHQLVGVLLWFLSSDLSWPQMRACYDLWRADVACLRSFFSTTVYPGCFDPWAFFQYWSVALTVVLSMYSATVVPTMSATIGGDW